MRMPLCESAKKGKVCIDDLCRSAIGGGETLCGFDPCEYEQMTSDYEDEDPWSDEDDYIAACGEQE